MEGICRRRGARFEQHTCEPWPICPECRNELAAEEVRKWRKRRESAAYVLEVRDA